MATRQVLVRQKSKKTKTQIRKANADCRANHMRLCGRSARSAVHSGSIRKCAAGWIADHKNSFIDVHFQHIVLGNALGIRRFLPTRHVQNVFAKRYKSDISLIPYALCSGFLQVRYVSDVHKEAFDMEMMKKQWTETSFKSLNGYLAGAILLALLVFIGMLLADGGVPSPRTIGYASVIGTFVLILSGGFYMLQPNEAAIVTLFGDYRGTDRSEGLRWRIPFYALKKISLRSRNLNGDRLKVNDKSGNPIEIAAAIVWRVEDTAQAVFEIDDYESYVHVQSEAAVRHVASRYHYDNNEAEAERATSAAGEQMTLRGSTADVARALMEELQERLGKAGVAVEEARLTHLAYAPEIASAMLRRQQAEAVIAARSKIVHGAVTMVEMALNGLSEKNLVELDNERKAAMVSNLLVVLCAESNVQPIVNTGTLYN
jgi:regulator of protease activity HflC (stomatin/prohibitin superfamily)